MIKINIPFVDKKEVTPKDTKAEKKDGKRILTSYEFEKAAKNAVVKILDEKHHLSGIGMEDLQFVWFSYTLGMMKCMIYSPKMFEFYAEVTYNKGLCEMYVDIYEKISNDKIKLEDFNYDAI